MEKIIQSILDTFGIKDLLPLKTEKENTYAYISNNVLHICNEHFQEITKEMIGLPQGLLTLYKTDDYYCLNNDGLSLYEALSFSPTNFLISRNKNNDVVSTYDCPVIGDFGKAIRQIREAHGFSLADIENATEIKRTTLLRLENEGFSSHMRKVLILLKVLNTKISICNKNSNTNYTVDDEDSLRQMCKDIRKKQMMSQKEFANAIGVNTRTSILMIEQGRSVPTLSSLYRITDRFGYRISLKTI